MKHSAESIESHHIPELCRSIKTNCWECEGALRRSSTLTPLYVDRYIGARGEYRSTTHDYWEFTYVFKGRGTLQCSGNFELSPKTAFLVPPGMPHNELSEGSLDTLWIGLHGARLNHLDASQLYFAFNASEIFEWAERLWLTSERLPSQLGPECDGLLRCLLNTFFRILSEQTSPCLDRVDNAIRFINEHHHQNLSIADIAEHIGCSEGYFFRIFKNQVGLPPLEYLTRIRLRRAINLLQQTSYSINAISRLVGFQDIYYFRRLFKQRMKMTPTAFRDKHKKTNKTRRPAVTRQSLPVAASVDIASA